jgi:hypothetical protein
MLALTDTSSIAPSGDIIWVNIHSLATIAAAMSNKPKSRSLVSEEKIVIKLIRDER